jgi:hypothetical protein
MRGLVTMSCYKKTPEAIARHAPEQQSNVTSATYSSMVLENADGYERMICAANQSRWDRTRLRIPLCSARTDKNGPLLNECNIPAGATAHFF